MSAGWAGQASGGPAVGRSVAHESAALHVTGAAMFTDDLAGRHRGLLHAWPVRSPHTHARVTALRGGRALALPGVVRVLTASDVPGEAIGGRAVTRSSSRPR